ncbi:hypothetical protein [Mycobacterium sp.]|uniref:hypothetical protein n=1 Tax=Mycobacterium sp. TaxID=1785 RepID=UPI003C75CD04
MTDVNQRLADILADYSDTMSRIERSSSDVHDVPYGGPILKPADQQQSCRAPTFGPDR